MAIQVGVLVAHCLKVSGDPHTTWYWHPYRPGVWNKPYYTLKQRAKDAWAVLWGRYNAVDWGSDE